MEQFGAVPEITIPDTFNNEGFEDAFETEEAQFKVEIE